MHQRNPLLIHLFLVSLCCYNLQFVEWMERNEYNDKLIQIQQKNLSCGGAAVVMRTAISIM